MSPDVLVPESVALNLGAPAPDEAGNSFYNIGYAAVPGADEIIVISLSKMDPSLDAGPKLVATGYGLTGAPGAVIFQTVLADTINGNAPAGVFEPSITALANGTVAIAWQVAIVDHPGDAQDSYAVLSGSGQILAGGALYKDRIGAPVLNFQGSPDLYATAQGFNMEWNAHSAALAATPTNPLQFAYEVQSIDLSGLLSVRYTTTAPAAGLAFLPHAFAAAGALSLQLVDNAVQVYDGTTLVGGTTLPGEPAHAITSEAVAILADGQAAVAWVDSGTAYVSLFDPSTRTFSGLAGLDWGGVSDVHVVALPDGGYATSWMNVLPPFGSPMGHYPLYEGRVFAADGTGGAVMELTGDVAGIDSHGDLYAVAASAGHEYVADYRIYGGSLGGPGDDVLHLGRSGDTASGRGGNDVFAFAEVPWNGGHITDFGVGDQIDLTGLLATTGYTGSDPIGAGFLKITTDAAGNGQVWADYNQPGNDGWWLVTTVDGVGGPALQLHDGIVRDVAGDQTIYTSAGHYLAAPSDTAVHLTGSDQTVDASAAQGAVTLFSNDSGNVLIGGVHDDIFQLGRGGDVVTGGAGADTFAYAETPWAGGHITDFNGGQGDVLDLSGLLAVSGYTGSDPFADGYLKATTAADGSAQLWSDVHQPGNDGWWLVATLDGASTSSLHYANGMIT